MPYYVPLGARGQVLRLGAWITAALGTLVYWRATLRRPHARLAPPTIPLPAPPPSADRLAA